MSFEAILKNVSRHIKLSSEEEKYFISILKNKKIKRRQFLVQAGDVCRFENYVTKGCLRAYIIDTKGTEHIVQFAIEDWWIGDSSSFVTQTPASLNVDALEDAEVLQLEKESLEKLLIEIPKFERYFRILFQRAFVAQQHRALSVISKSAEERFLEFRKKYPAFEKRLPQTQIASYLGVTPEFLSKVRKNVSLAGRKP